MSPRSTAVALAVRALLGALVFTGCRESGPSMAERAAAVRAAGAAADAVARDETKARLETQRLAGLWRYQDATVGGGAQVTAAIFAADGVDADGRGLRPVQLVFRDHEKWGKSGYLARIT